MSNVRIGIFGGTFDPPHLGHLILASEAWDQLALSRLLWVLTPIPPHKLDQAITPLTHRLEMVQRAIAETPAFELSRVEIDRPGPHYMLDTLTLISRQNPNAEIIPLIGGDSLHDLPNWHRPADILSVCHYLGVMRRPNDAINLATLETILPGITNKARFIEASMLEISSSEIRQRIATNRPYRYYLPHGVYEYILEHNLYHLNK